MMEDVLQREFVEEIRIDGRYSEGDGQRQRCMIIIVFQLSSQILIRHQTKLTVLSTLLVHGRSHMCPLSVTYLN
jgi:hypothetical protein